MLHNRLPSILSIVVLGATLVVMSALRYCNAFVVQPGQHVFGADKLHSRHTMSELFLMRKSKSSERNDDKNRPATTKRKYTTVEDGSPLGVAVVGLGFLALKMFGDRLDDSAIQQYAVPIIFCSASLAAGISRLVRNSKG